MGPKVSKIALATPTTLSAEVKEMKADRKRDKQANKSAYAIKIEADRKRESRANEPAEAKEK